MTTEHVQRAPSTTRAELHEFIDTIDDELARPGLHATIDMLPEDLISVVLDRMRALRERRTVLPPHGLR